ncbi:MAG: hypothetical protein WEB57_05950 [Pseudohongiellaceae bacterium]
MNSIRSIFTWLVFVAAACASVAFPAAVSASDSSEYEEWSAETRMSLAMRVNGDAVRSLLPEDWTVAAAAEAPEQVNLTVTFMDRHLILDPQGQPVGTGSSRYMVLSVLARNAQGESSILIINGISPEGTGAYEVYQPAVVARAERSLNGQGDSNPRVEENWEMVADSGDAVSLTLRYQQAVPTRRQSSVVIRSGKNTGYTRTYTIDQANDALGVPGVADSRIESFRFAAEGPLFSRLFDGNEVITGVTSTPWYNREITIP